MGCNTTVYQFIERGESHSHPNPSLPIISIENQDCLEMAQTLHLSTGQPICLLNMANQEFVGGDYQTAIGGQEESLIRRTNLLESLVQLEGVEKNANRYIYKLANRLILSKEENAVGLGELTCLYSPNVTAVLNEKKDDSFIINIISSAAYNLAYYNEDLDPDLYQMGTILKIINQLRTAKINGQRHLVLGAFGCGAFHNPPGFVASAYHSVIHEFEFQGCFDSITFAIKVNHPDDPVYVAFQQAFLNKAELLCFQLCFEKIQKNPLFSRFLSPFLLQQSSQELLYNVTRLIEREHQLLSGPAHKVLLKMDLLNNLLSSLRSNPNAVIETLQLWLMDGRYSNPRQNTSVFVFKSSFVTKLETLLNRIPNAVKRDRAAALVEHNEIKKIPRRDP